MRCTLVLCFNTESHVFFRDSFKKKKKYFAKKKKFYLAFVYLKRVLIECLGMVYGGFDKTRRRRLVG